MEIVASVLHLGNTQFGEDEEGETHITTEPQLQYLSQVSWVLMLWHLNICLNFIPVSEELDTSLIRVTCLRFVVSYCEEQCPEVVRMYTFPSLNAI